MQPITYVTITGFIMKTRDLKKSLIGLGSLASTISSTVTPAEVVKSGMIFLASILPMDWMIAVLDG